MVWIRSGQALSWIKLYLVSVFSLFCKIPQGHKCKGGLLRVCVVGLFVS